MAIDRVAIDRVLELKVGSWYPSANGSGTTATTEAAAATTSTMIHRRSLAARQSHQVSRLSFAIAVAAFPVYCGGGGTLFHRGTSL